MLLARHARALNKRIDGLDNATVRRLAGRPLEGQRPRAGQRPGTSRDPRRRPDPDPRKTSPETSSPTRALDADADDLRAALDRFERQHIRRVLDRCEGDKKEAARRLNLGLSSLYRKLEDPAPRDD